MPKPSTISSTLEETRVFEPSAAFVANAQISPAEFDAMRKTAASDPVAFWADHARKDLVWQSAFTQTLDASHAPNYRWFADGTLNVAANCLDCHISERGDKVAVRFEGEPGDTRTLTYRELLEAVSRFANALKALGAVKADRIVIYMPMTADAIIAMLACARIGAIHSVVFGGFSATSLKDRIEDAQARFLITSDGGYRGGKIVELKNAADEALAGGCPSIEKLIVFKRCGQPIEWHTGRDLWAEELMAAAAPDCPAEAVDAEHPLFLLYTSGSTGKPKGIQHSSAGYLLGAKMSCRWVFDLKEDDVMWCTADVGWITGHSYVCYGPLAAGATVVLYEGSPMTPNPGRFWKICQDHGVTIFYTAPTAIRALMKFGERIPAGYDLSRLRILGSVGEPINPEAWIWYHRAIGKEQLPIVDTWWQTETGNIMISPLPASTATKPGSCTQPLPGIFAEIVDEAGNPVLKAHDGGQLVITQPWPAMLRTIWGDNERYLKTYYPPFDNGANGPAPNRRMLYVAGDSARRDADGYYWIMGRLDDVLNVSGHRLGTMEIESALVSHPAVAEAAVVGRPDELKGEAIVAFVTCRGDRPTGEEAAALKRDLRNHVSKAIGALAKPDDVRFGDNLPKTRSGKIMRRLLRSIARGEPITQDISTLENPAIVEQLAGKS